MNNDVHATAVIHDNVIMGKGNKILAGAVIGSHGAIRDCKIWSGKVVIGDNNYIGANSVIAVGEVGETKIGSDNIIMNLANIGHNCEIGDNNEIGAGTIIPGHVLIKNNVKIKSNCTVKTFVGIEDGVIIGQASNVTRGIVEPGLYYGAPAKFVREEYTKRF